MGFDERVDHDQADAVGAGLLAHRVLVGEGDAGHGGFGQQQAAVAPMVQEQAALQLVRRDGVQAHEGGQAAVQLVGGVFQVHDPGGDAVVHVLVQQVAPGGEAGGGGERQGGLADAAGCDEQADEAADQAGAEQPFAGRDGLGGRQRGRAGAERDATGRCGQAGVGVPCEVWLQVV